MTDKKRTEELNETELDQVTGGLSIGDIKPGLTEKVGKRFNGSGIRAVKKGPDGFASSGSGNPTV
tara:strand:+ start:1056 stop:1250 length:195 start_codon:yes stop_codon:yes gene_type:complete